MPLEPEVKELFQGSVSVLKITNDILAAYLYVLGESITGRRIPFDDLVGLQSDARAAQKIITEELAKLNSMIKDEM